MDKTNEEYDTITARCEAMFLKKTKDYGTTWRILRPSSLTDQLFIKAQRIRTIQESGVNLVGEDIEGEFEALVNYAAMALIQCSIDKNTSLDLDEKSALILYAKQISEARALMQKKNHDYGEAWRDMRVSSLTDLILAKLLRIKQIEDNQGVTIASEGVEGNYFDILNYAIFALIHSSYSNQN
jgi:hypothetical protein